MGLSRASSAPAQSCLSRLLARRFTRCARGDHRRRTLRQGASSHRSASHSQAEQARGLRRALQSKHRPWPASLQSLRTRDVSLDEQGTHQEDGQVGSAVLPMSVSGLPDRTGRRVRRGTYGPSIAQFPPHPCSSEQLKRLQTIQKAWDLMWPAFRRQALIEEVSSLRWDGDQKKLILEHKK